MYNAFLLHLQSSGRRDWDRRLGGVHGAGYRCPNGRHVIPFPSFPSNIGEEFSFPPKPLPQLRFFRHGGEGVLVAVTLKAMGAGTIEHHVIPFVSIGSRSIPLLLVNGRSTPFFSINCQLQFSAIPSKRRPETGVSLGLHLTPFVFMEQNPIPFLSVNTVSLRLRSADRWTLGQPADTLLYCACAYRQVRLRQASQWRSR